MNGANVTETMKWFNSFDYVFIIYLLWQIYVGYSQGFRLMLYQTVKWIVLVGGLFMANHYLLPVMMKQPFFMEKSKAVNKIGYDLVLQFGPKDNPIAAEIFRRVAESIPYDKIVFFLLVILVFSVILRIIIIGSVWGKEVEGRTLGVAFGVLKAILICYVVMSFIGTFMERSDPEGFLRWQEQSFILSKTGIRF
ncbi:MAG: CvpA family protein [Peptostreptococcaceae bacterium]|nr:CvpA family protein [Peptostreptococcaceae bacterium]